MGFIEQIKRYALYLFERAFGWQKEELKWKQNVPFHYLPVEEAVCHPDYTKCDGSEAPKKRGRKPKQVEVVEAPKTTAKKTTTKPKVKDSVKTGTVTRKAVKAAVSKTSKTKK